MEKKKYKFYEFTGTGTELIDLMKALYERQEDFRFYSFAVPRKFIQVILDNSDEVLKDLLERMRKYHKRAQLHIQTAIETDQCVIANFYRC